MKIKTQEVQTLLNQFNRSKQYPLSEECFIDNAKRYIKAIKEERMICSIGSVSQSGMSRTIKFVELAKSQGNKFHIMLNFFQLFEVLGYQKIKNSDYFRIHGCGMDMIFNTNYNNIHHLHNLGFMTKKMCDSLAQKTPHVI